MQLCVALGLSLLSVCMRWGTNQKLAGLMCDLFQTMMHPLLHLVSANIIGIVDWLIGCLCPMYRRQRHFDLHRFVP